MWGTLLDPEVLVEAVDNWNALCEKGVDDELPILYNPAWLIPVKDPPYYSAIVGGQMGKLHAGLRVTEDMEVVKPDGKTIPGLYATFTTAGGIAGESNFGCSWNSTFLGGLALVWVSGYIAAETILAG